MNGDGKPDLATANEEGNTVSVLLNRGDGSFQPKRDYPTGSTSSRPFGRPYGVAIGDVNGDGRADLASANSGDHTVSVLLNRGDGSFDKRDYAQSAAPEAVAIGDLNADGKQDIAFAGVGVWVLLNKGDGNLEDARHYPTARGSASVAIDDLNGDGRVDLATANVASDSVSVLLNGDGGIFGNRRDYRAGFSPFSAAIGDVNGDRKADLVSANDDARSISVFVNRGDGSFEAKRDYQTGPVDAGPVSVALGDINGDHRLDAATANQRVASVSVLLNTRGLCNVQDVLRKTLGAAKRLLARVNCRVGKVTHAYSKKVRRGRIISQRPRRGAVLPKGGKVNIVVSRGRQ